MPVARPVPQFPLDTLTVRPWADPVLDALGHDPRSAYVERYWLGILGPSTTWLLRRLVAGLEESPDGFELPLAETAQELGLGSQGGRHSPFMRALVRCCQFGAAQHHADTLMVRRRLAPLTRRQVERLPDGLRASHDAWQAAQLHAPPSEQLRQRARRLAASLFELGEDREATERQLGRWRFHPTVCREATEWAWARHLAQQSPGPPDAA